MKAGNRGSEFDDSKKQRRHSGAAAASLRQNPEPFALLLPIPGSALCAAPE
jgi:hypothetical protein